LYTGDDVVGLVAYQKCDDLALYSDWLDPDTCEGFNGVYVTSFEEFARREVRSRFFAMICLRGTGEIVGAVGLSPPEDLADLTIHVFRPYRGKGYGTAAFALAAKYIFDVLGITEIYAGAYAGNIASRKMLERCGFVPHPAGNLREKYYRTGADIVQLDHIFDRRKLP